MENELILRPQEENRLAVLRTSPKNYCKALCPKKVEDVFQSDEPSIGTIIRKFGEPQARAVLVILIADALEFFNVGNPMSATQVATTVDLIIEEYPYMKTDDFKLCFKNAMKMKYGNIYNRIDGQVIMSWLREYNKERCAVADNQSWNFHKENLSEEVNYTSGLSYEQLLMVKRIVISVRKIWNCFGKRKNVASFKYVISPHENGVKMAKFLFA